MVPPMWLGSGSILDSREEKTGSNNPDSTNFARIPVVVETIIMETIRRSLPSNGTVSTCLARFIFTKQ